MTAALFMPPTTTQVAAADPVADVPAPAAQPARAMVGPDDLSPTKAMILPPTPQPFDAVPALTPLQPAPTTAPTAVPADPPATPTDLPVPPSAAAVASGVYMTVGGVLAQVNDTPIYAHTVLALLDKELATRARDMDPDEFRRYAAEKIVRQTGELIHDEEDFAMAFKALTAEDKKLADEIAAESRLEKVKQAGGSAELARRRAAGEGLDFDEQMRQDYRRIVVGIYQHRFLDPLVQVSAQDMREFYHANADHLYGDKDRLQFRVIEIDPTRMGGEHPRVAALAKIREIREKAVNGQDFAALASTENHDDGLRATGGDPGGWMERGSYRVDAVEQPLWRLRPGQVTGVIEAEGVFYVAKLEDKHEGRTRPFEDPTVQDDVYKRLRQQQAGALRDRLFDGATADAVVSTPAGSMETALEMVMQKYVRWAGR